MRAIAGAAKALSTSSAARATELPLRDVPTSVLRTLDEPPIASTSRADPTAAPRVLSAKARGKQRAVPDASEPLVHGAASPLAQTREDWRLRALSRSPYSARLRPTRNVRRLRSKTALEPLEAASALETYSKTAIKLIDMEREASRARAVEELGIRGVGDRMRGATPIGGLVGRWLDASERAQFASAEGSVACFERDRDADEYPLPASEYRARTMVFVAVDRGGGPDAPWPETPIVGRVCICTSKRLIVELDADVSMPSNRLFRIAFAWDDTVFRRQLQAIETLPASIGESAPSDDLARDQSKPGTSTRVEPVKIGTELRAKLLDPSLGPSRSSVFTENQHINSWVQRHLRSPALTMEGDPELGLNEAQTRAVALALDNRLSLIQGPPGTGKTMTIIAALRLLKLHFQVPQGILVCAPTHIAVDHLTAAAAEGGLRPLRIGRTERVSASMREHTLDMRFEAHPMSAALEVMRTERARMCMQLDMEDMDDLAARAARSDTMVAPPSDMGDAEGDANLRRKLGKLRAQIWGLEQRMMSDICDSADVVFSTALAAHSTFLDVMDFPVVFLDEAAQCNETSSLVPLMKGSRHLVLIGDHKQLPSICVSRSAAEAGYNVSLFERLMTSLVVPSIVLNMQYRMQPDISYFPNEHFYESKLEDAALVRMRAALDGMATHPLLGTRHVAFLDHEGASVFEDKSIANYEEVDVVVALVADLVRRLPRVRGHQIGIVSPYARQTRLFERAFSDLAAGRRTDLLASGKDADRVRGIQCATVDGYQGREKDFIVFATSRSKPKYGSNLGFLADPRRLCVALTRARHALFIVGNAETLSGVRTRPVEVVDGIDAGDRALTIVAPPQPGIWSALIDWLRSEKLVWRWDAVRPLLGAGAARSPL